MAPLGLGHLRGRVLGGAPAENVDLLAGDGHGHGDLDPRRAGGPTGARYIPRH